MLTMEKSSSLGIYMAVMPFSKCPHFILLMCYLDVACQLVTP